MGRQARLLAALGIGGLMAAAGCGQPAAAPATAPRTLPNPTAIAGLPVAPTWSTSLPGPITVSIAADGSAAAGSSAGGPWSYSAAGVPLPLGSGAGSAVWALPGQMLAIGPGVSDPAGPATLSTDTGASVWADGTIGPVVAVADPDGSRVAVLDAGSATATELVLSPSGSVNTFGLGSGQSAQFDENGDALVFDAQHAELYSPSGAVRWTEALKPNTPPRSFVLDRNGAGVTVATTGADNSLYQFSLNGSSLGVSWSQPLPPGGSNQLVAGPDGRVAVWGVGGAATLALYRQQDGTRLWEDTVPAAAGVKAAVTDVAFAADGGLAVGLSGCTASGAPCVLLLGPDGTARGEVPMPDGTHLTLAANARVAVAAQPASSGGDTSQISWYDLPDPATGGTGTASTST